MQSIVVISVDSVYQFWVFRGQIFDIFEFFTTTSVYKTVASITQWSRMVIFGQNENIKISNFWDHFWVIAIIAKKISYGEKI